MSGDFTEIERIEKARAGDRDAFSVLVLAYQSSIRSFLARTIPNADDVFELAQDVFLEAYRHLERFDPNRDFGAWLRGIARYRAIDHLRKTRSRRKNEIGEVDSFVMEWQAAALESMTDAEDEPLEDHLVALRNCVGKLKDKAGKLLAMRYFRNMSTPSIAQKIGRTEGAVRIALMRIKQTLRMCMDAVLSGEEAHSHAR